MTSTASRAGAAGTPRAGRRAAPSQPEQAAAAPEPDLRALLAHRRWLYRSDPFPHVRARNVFTPAFAAELDAAFKAVLDLGYDAGTSGFARSIPGYDAFGHTFRPGVGWPFSIFSSRAWHDLLCDVTGVKGSGQVFTGLHHHLPGSQSGSPHNDLNPGWFPGVAGPGEVVMSDATSVVYATGEALVPDVTPAGAIRAIAVLYFLHNGPWTPGDGGEIGFYASANDPIARPAVAVPPIDNSIVLFECTPHSLHGFIQNRRTPRNSMIMWVHRPRSDVEAQWGAPAIVEWPKAKAAKNAG